MIIHRWCFVPTLPWIVGHLMQFCPGTNICSWYIFFHILSSRIWTCHYVVSNISSITFPLQNVTSYSSHANITCHHLHINVCHIIESLFNCSSYAFPIQIISFFHCYIFIIIKSLSCYLFHIQLIQCYFFILNSRDTRKTK